MPILKIWVLWNMLYFKRFTMVYQLHVLLHFLQTSDNNSSETTEEYSICIKYKHVDKCISTENTEL